MQTLLLCFVLYVDSFSLADRCFHSDCAERSERALWQRAADRQPPRSQVGPAGEEPGHRAAGREPASHRPAAPQSYQNSGLPQPSQGKVKRSHRRYNEYSAYGMPWCLVFLVADLQREEFTREPALLKKLCSAVREGVTVDNCCDLFTAIHCLCGDDLEEDFQPEQQRQEVVNKSRFFALS